MSEKLCIFCSHFDDRIEANPSCKKGYYEPVEVWDEDDLSHLIVQARACLDYEKHN